MDAATHTIPKRIEIRKTIQGLELADELGEHDVEVDATREADQWSL
jgi:hypothetical protein